MKRAPFLLPILCFLWAIVFFACASVPKEPMTPIQRYATASSEFTHILKKYNEYYALATPEVQQQWDAKYQDTIRKVDIALDLWRDALFVNPSDAFSKEEAYMAIKQVLIIALKEVILE